jgi:hypothetical protein
MVPVTTLPVVLGQADAKNASPNDLVEARRRFGSGGTDEGDQKQASKEARSKSDGTLKKCTGHGNLGPPLQRRPRVRHLVANLNWRRAFGGPQRGVQSRWSNRNGRTGPSWIDRASG